MSNDTNEVQPLKTHDYVDASGYRITVTGDLPTDPFTMVEFFQQGGGFSKQMPLGLFHSTFKSAPAPQFAPIRVRGDWFPHEVMTLPAYGDGTFWNGWAMPYFDRAGADALAGLMDNVTYDEELDAFVAKTESAEDEPEVYESSSITVNGAAVQVYAIGAGSWCWDEITPADVEGAPEVPRG